MNSQTPSPALLAGRRALDGLPNVHVLTDWTWSPQAHKWVLHVRLTTPADLKGLIPPSTEWYVLVDAEYPLGQIKFFPSKLNSIQVTFPHQHFNGAGGSDSPWRSGDLCLDTHLRILGRFDIELYDEHRRLEWHFRRALGWLEDASSSRLAVDGDPFELPDFQLDSAICTVAFSESRETFALWQSLSNTCGIVELRRPSLWRRVLVVRRFLSLEKQELVPTLWGTAIEQSKDADEPITGAWLRLNSVPVLEPWQAPSTWGELRAACRDQGIDVLLRKCVNSFRNGKPLLVMLGFAIPEKVGASPILMHWLPLWIPAVAAGDVPGFRNSEKSHWLRDSSQVFGQGRKIDWQKSENWDNGQISTRGRLNDAITSKRVLVIGAGAIGAAIAELLVRSGVRELTIIDGDTLEVGNLSRHTLGIGHVGESKSLAVAGRLNKASPHATVRGMNDHFPPRAKEDFEWLQEQNLVVDCTGNDQALHQVEQFPWRYADFFFSISVGFRARRLFFYAQRSRFTVGTFQRSMRPWLMEELGAAEREGLPREAVGCWHPVFPARSDEIWLMSSAAIPMLESYISGNTANPALIVFEKVLTDGPVRYIQHVTEIPDATQ
jgi:hypothetical protein